MQKPTEIWKPKSYNLGKRIVDLFGAILGLMVLFLLFPIIAILIQWDSKGPTLFVQTRVGQYGRRFKFIKFRTMSVGAFDKQWELSNLNETGGLTFKVRNDPRITSIGRFLRRTSMDEIPQFWNVLKGEMSLVGPRPPLLQEVERYDDAQKIRMIVPQGMTGLWQIRGRSRLGFDAMVDLDVQYALNASFLLDLKIIVLTFPTLLWGRGAV